MPPALLGSFFKAFRVKNPTISNLTLLAMLALAAFFEGMSGLIGLIPLVGMLSIMLNFLGGVIFVAWFWVQGVPFMSGERAMMKILSFTGGLTAELMYPLSIITPGMFVLVFGVVIGTRLEDMAREAKKGQESEAALQRVSIKLGGPRKIPAPANDNESGIAANDEPMEEVRQAA